MGTLVDRDRAMWQLRLVIATIEGEIRHRRGNGALADRCARVVENTLLNYDVAKDTELSAMHSRAEELIRGLRDHG